MTRLEFTLTMERELQTLPVQERQDIIRDYDEHFNEGLKAGKSEAEIVKRLGDPKTLAEAHLEGRERQSPPVQQTYTQPPPVYGSGQNYQQPPPDSRTPPYRQSETINVFGKNLGDTLRSLLNVAGWVVMLALYIAVIVTAFSIPLSMLSAGVVLSVVSVYATPELLAGLVCLQIAFYGFAFSGAVLAGYLTKWCIKTGRAAVLHFQNSMNQQGGRMV